MYMYIVHTDLFLIIFFTLKITKPTFTLKYTDCFKNFNCFIYTEAYTDNFIVNNVKYCIIECSHCLTVMIVRPLAFLIQHIYELCDCFRSFSFASEGKNEDTTTAPVK